MRHGAQQGGLQCFQLLELRKPGHLLIVETGVLDDDCGLSRHRGQKFDIAPGITGLNQPGSQNHDAG